jgi:hypothetical protein
MSMAGGLAIGIAVGVGVGIAFGADAYRRKGRGEKEISE